IDWITREGKQADGQWATFSDPSGGIALPDDFSASIEWGDGTRTKGVVTPERPGFYSVRATKAYRRFGQFPITVYVTDRFLRIAIAHGTATVLDAPVSVWGGKLIGRVGRPVRGRVAIITDDNQLAHRTDFRTTISWGDG